MTVRDSQAPDLAARAARFTADYGIFLILLVLVLALSILTPMVRGEQYFLTTRNLLQVLLQASINTIIAIGMTFVITSRGIDLAVESLIKVIEGRPVAPAMESPVVLITQANLPE